MIPPRTSLPLPPCAPCSMQAFEAWAQEVIRHLQPHSYKPDVAGGDPVQLFIRDLPAGTLGLWRSGDHSIHIRRSLAEECCSTGTAALVDTLLHECAHMLAPAGAAHGPLWQRCAEILGCHPAAHAPDRQSHTNPNMQSFLTPEQIIGAEPLSPAEPPDSTTTNGQNVPSFDARAPYHQLAGWVAACVPHGSLFRMDNSYVTIHIEENGLIKLSPMTKLRLPTWLPEQRICTFHGGKRKNALPDEPPPVTSISPAQAELIMASDVFRERMPELRGVSNVRLPIIVSEKKGETTVHKATGEKVTRHLRHFTFEPSSEGYDPRSKIYTHSTIKQNFDTVFSLEKARNFIIKAYSEAALDGGFEGEDAIHPLQSRSLGAVVTAMLGQYLHHNIDTFPLILIVANQPGTGKSFLAKTILSPIHGEIEADNYQDDDKEFRQTLNSLILEGARFCWLDDLKHLKSPTLNRFITSTRIRDRILHSQTTFSKEMRMQFFATGNALKVTPDLQRRALPIDLFWAQDSTQRKFQGVLSEESLTQPDIRSSFLRCLWSFTKDWQDAGCPRYIEKAPGGSFEKYITLAANIAIHAGFANPYGPRLVDLDSGDAVGKALQEVLITMADSISPPFGQPHRGAWQKFRVADLEDFATRMHKIDIIVPYGNNKRDNLGQAMRSMKGRELIDNRGRRFGIGSKRDSASSIYQFTILSEPTRDLSDTAAATLAEAKGDPPDPDPEF